MKRQRKRIKGEVGLETPSGFKRKADEIRDSFGRLVQSFPTDAQLISVAREFDTWHYKATQESSAVSQIFTSGEIDKWLRRYASEYDRLTKSNPKKTTSAPRPLDIITPEKPPKTSPWVWAIVAASAAVSVYTVYRMREQ